MPLRLTRQRGKVWYAAGTVRVGKDRHIFDEHSTGYSARADAERYCAKIQAETEQRLYFGGEQRGRVTWRQAMSAYNGALNHSTIPRLDKILGYFEPLVGLPANLTPDHWREFDRMELSNLLPGTRAQYQALLKKLLRDAGLEVPKFPSIGAGAEVVAWLTPQEADVFISCYADFARPVARTARYQGLRAGEIARLECRDVDLDHGKAGALTVREPKNGRPRIVPLHPLVREDLVRLEVHKRVGRVFLNGHGFPYRETRDKGGNPFSRAHSTARKRAVALGHPDLADFRFHDWRHHWASQFVRSGGDLVSLKEMGGWSDLRMLTRYVHVDFDHCAEQLARVR